MEASFNECLASGQAASDSFSKAPLCPQCNEGRIRCFPVLFFERFLNESEVSHRGFPLDLDSQYRYQPNLRSGSRLNVVRKGDITSYSRRLPPYTRTPRRTRRATQRFLRHCQLLPVAFLILHRAPGIAQRGLAKKLCEFFSSLLLRPLYLPSLRCHLSAEAV